MSLNISTPSIALFAKHWLKLYLTTYLSSGGSCVYCPYTALGATHFFSAADKIEKPQVLLFFLTKIQNTTLLHENRLVIKQIWKYSKLTNYHLIIKALARHLKQTLSIAKSKFLLYNP